jgi:hypothetical protein
MYSWSDLETHIKQNNCSYKFYRNIRTQNKLNKYKKYIEEKYKTYDDYIKINLLNWNKSVKNNKFVATKSDDIKEYLLRENPYPYDIQKNIKQYVFWTKTKMKKEDVNNIISSKLPNKEFLWYYSYTRNTVPTIKHYHVFVKN